MNIVGKLKKLINRDSSEDENELFAGVPAPTIEDLMVEREDCILSAWASRISINVMTVADSHGNLMQRELQKEYKKALSVGKLNAVFLLGDNFINDIETILEVIPEEVPIYGVVGNHDAKDLLVPYKRIVNVSGMCIAPIADNHALSEYDYAIAGLSGSIRYKDDDYYAMLTNEESDVIMAKLPYAEILLTHDKPCFQAPEKLTSHSGLTGIGSYILEKKPKIVLHGHLHERYIKQYGDTMIRCCYGVETFPIAF